jgi:hypothetical protein
MRTASICPTCSTFENALCVLYNGDYLTNTDITPLDSVETAIIKINDNLVPITGTVPPVNSAIYLGQLYLDTSAPTLYFAESIGTGANDWVALGASTPVNTSSGTYVPVVVGVLNIDSAIGFNSHYMRTEGQVSVQGSLELSITAFGVFELIVALPISSNLVALTDVSGTAISYLGLPGITNFGYIEADVVNNQAILKGINTITSPTTFYFNFTYTIL